MVKEFTKNMFVMLLAIMLGAVIVTYFVGDIVNRSKIETLTTQYEGEITSVKDRSENFTSHFLKSSVVLDQSREDRALGNYYFDLAYLWYETALSEKNVSLLTIYKGRGIENCTYAMPVFYNAYLNFLDAKTYFNDTKAYTDKYFDILDLYVNLTESGSRLTMLRYNASLYLMYLTENLTFNAVTNTVVYLENVTGLLMIFQQTILEYKTELIVFENLQQDIDEYEFFEEIR